MKILSSIKKAVSMLALCLFSGIAFAADDSSWQNLASFGGNIQYNAGLVYRITIVIATLAGLILIVKGLVHLKQNYTGTGQEKHLSKGIASLGFGTALILAVPLSHALVGGMGTSTTFDTGVDSSIQFGSSTLVNQ